MSNPNKLIRIITGRDKGRKAKPLKVILVWICGLTVLQQIFPCHPTYFSFIPIEFCWRTAWFRKSLDIIWRSGFCCSLDLTFCYMVLSRINKLLSRQLWKRLIPFLFHVTGSCCPGSWYGS
jgi:hypothetical protein